MDAPDPRQSGCRALSVAGFVYDTGRFSEEGSPGRELSSNFLYICFLRAKRHGDARADDSLIGPPFYGT